MDFKRAGQLFEQLFKIIGTPEHIGSVRTQVSTELALVTLNLLGSIHLLCGEKHFNGAGIILRSQYETFVRSVWSYHSATDAQVEKLSATLTKDLRISVCPDSDSGIIRTSVPVSSGQVNFHLA